MKKYFIQDDAGQQGPFDLQELKEKGITAATSVREEGQENWTSAGELEELKDLFAVPVMAADTVVQTAAAMPAETSAPAVEAVPEPKTVVPETAPAVAAAATIPASAAPVAKAARKTGNAAVTWALSLAAIAGTGYFVYQDMEKNKNPATTEIILENTETVPAEEVTSKENPDTTVTLTPEMNLTDSEAAITTVPVTTTTTLSANPNDPAAVKKAEEEKKKLLAVQAKKKEEDKKKLMAEAKKKEEEKKRLAVAQAAAAREMELRNNWPRYVSLGSFKIEGDDKVKPFAIPVYNRYAVPLDRVTLRVDYIKKDKNVGSETLVLENIYGNNSQVAQASGNKKAKTANVYITGISSRQLHFCYPLNNGSATDPYYCK